MTFKAMEDCVTLNGATSSDNYVNTRYSSVTASCQDGTLPTPSLANGFVISVIGTRITRKQSQQLLRQLSTSGHSMVLVSNGGGQARLIGAYDFNNCANSR
jgi:hypothetical protein